MLQRHCDDFELLPLLTVNILLMIQSLVQGISTDDLRHKAFTLGICVDVFFSICCSYTAISALKLCSELYMTSIFNLIPYCLTGHYHKLRVALSSLPPSDSLTEAFIQLSTFYPLLSIQYANLSINLHGRELEWVSSLVQGMIFCVYGIVLAMTISDYYFSNTCISSFCRPGS